MKFLVGFVGIVVLLGSVSAAEWVPSDGLQFENETAGWLEGTFNLELVEEGARRVDFFVDGVQVASDRSAPFTLFDATFGELPQENHSIEARVFSKGSPQRFGYSVLAAAIDTNHSPGNQTNETPPANDTEPPANTTGVNLTNLLKNPNFSSGIANWYYFTDYSYVSWSPEGRLDAGALHFIPNAGSAKSTESWQGSWRVHPGDKIIYSGYFRAGPQGTKRWNNGTGLGWDLREIGDSTIFYTMNGPATMSQEWTYIYTEHTIPCIGRDDVPIEKWSTTDGLSGTQMGARGGLWNSQAIVDKYLDKPMPQNMSLVVWTHIWHYDTVQWADVDGLSLSIVPNATAC